MCKAIPALGYPSQQTPLRSHRTIARVQYYNGARSSQATHAIPDPYPELLFRSPSPSGQAPPIDHVTKSVFTWRSARASRDSRAPSPRGSAARDEQIREEAFELLKRRDALPSGS